MISAPILTRSDRYRVAPQGIFRSISNRKRHRCRAVIQVQKYVLIVRNICQQFAAFPAKQIFPHGFSVRRNIHVDYPGIGGLCSPQASGGHKAEVPAPLFFRQLAHLEGVRLVKFQFSNFPGARIHQTWYVAPQSLTNGTMHRLPVTPNSRRGDQDRHCQQQNQTIPLAQDF